MLACALGLAACSGEVDEAVVDGSQAVNSAGKMVDESRAEALQESADEALTDERLEEAPDPRPVRTGLAGTGADACGGYGEIRQGGGESKGEDMRVQVRHSPNPEGREIDLLKPATPVSICESEGEWLGIVFAGPDQTLSECETGAAIAQAQDYAGPCRSGWIERRLVDLMAG